MSENTEKTIYVSLSSKDHQCIMDDIMIFRCNPKDKNGRYRFSYQQFLRRIFLNIHDKTDFVEQNKIHRKRASKNQDGRRTIKINNTITTKIFKNIERLYQKKWLGSVFDAADMECIEKNGLTPGILRGANYAQLFVLCIIYYCSLSMPEREAVIYRQSIEDLEEHIKNHEIITILKNKPVLGTKSANYKDKDESKITVLPYKIGVTKESNRHYLACFRMMQEEKGWSYLNLESVPVKNIIPYYYDNNKEWFRVHQKINPDRDIHFREPKKDGRKFCSSYSEMIGYMESRLALDGYEYLPDSTKEVKVELTPKGFERLYDWANFRPKFTAYEDEGYITFEATFMQTFRYFFKFGKEARITSPQEYIKDFKNALRKLSDIYEKDNGSFQDQNG